MRALPARLQRWLHHLDRADRPARRPHAAALVVAPPRADAAGPPAPPALPGSPTREQQLEQQLEQQQALQIAAEVEEDRRQLLLYGRVRTGCSRCDGEFYTPADAPEHLCGLCNWSWQTGGAQIDEWGAELLAEEMTAVHTAVLAGQIDAIRDAHHGRLNELYEDWRDWADTERAQGRMGDQQYQQVAAALATACTCPPIHDGQGHRPDCPPGDTPASDLPETLTCGHCGEPFVGFSDGPGICPVCQLRGHTTSTPNTVP